MLVYKLMETILYIFGSVIVISLISLIGVVTISIKESILKSALPSLVALAAGALLGGAVIHLIPEAFEQIGGGLSFSLTLLSGILVFFILERFLHWHHSHHANEEDCDTHDEREHELNQHTLAPLVISADAMHNLIDGVAIAAAYLVSIEVGIATTIAVLIHEIPQEISDFSLLLHSGMSRAKALLFNFASALTALIGAMAMLFVGASINNAIPYVAAITAGGFLYIAIADLVPTLHKEKRARQATMQFLAFLIGIGIMLLLALAE